MHKYSIGSLKSQVKLKCTENMLSLENLNSQLELISLGSFQPTAVNVGTVNTVVNISNEVTKGTEGGSSY